MVANTAATGMRQLMPGFLQLALSILFSSFGGLFFLEHGEHALGNDEPSENIDRGDDDCDESREVRETLSLGAERDDSADDDDARDGISDGHQRRVQGRGDFPHHVITDETRQHEYGEAE